MAPPADHAPATHTVQPSVVLVADVLVAPDPTLHVVGLHSLMPPAENWPTVQAVQPSVRLVAPLAFVTPAPAAQFWFVHWTSAPVDHVNFAQGAQPSWVPVEPSFGLPLPEGHVMARHVGAALSVFVGLPGEKLPAVHCTHPSVGVALPTDPVPAVAPVPAAHNCGLHTALPPPAYSPVPHTVHPWVVAVLPVPVAPDPAGHVCCVHWFLSPDAAAKVPTSQTVHVPALSY